MRLIGAGALFRNEAGHGLRVNPTYTQPWEIPGGIVEEGESPWQCCTRELLEELGYDGPLGRLLVVDWLPDLAGRCDRVLFIFDGGVLSTEAVSKIQLVDDELRAFEFCYQGQAKERLRPYAWRRVSLALDALETGRATYAQDGYP